MAKTTIKFNQLDLEGYTESGNTNTANVIASIGDFNSVNNNNFIRIDDGNNNITINGSDVIGFNKDIRISGTSTFFSRINADNLSTTNRTLNLPDAEGNLTISVNGFSADTFGNITIPISGGSSGSTIIIDSELSATSTNAVVNSAITTNINWLRSAQNFNELTKYETLPSVNRTYRVGSLNSALPDVSSIVFDRTFLHYNINGQRYLFVNKGSLQSGFISTEGGFLEMLELEDSQLYVVMSSRVPFPPNSGLEVQANQDRFYLKTNEITTLSGVDSNYTVYETGPGTVSSVDQNVGNDNIINLSLVKQGFTGSTGSGTTPTGLEAINEGNGVGWRLIGKNANNYGNIGQNAVDLSVSFNGFFDKGALGFGSFSQGVNTVASAQYSVAMGNSTTASSVNSLSIGANSLTSGDNALASGNNTRANGTNSFTMGENSEANGITSFAGGFSTISDGLTSFNYSYVTTNGVSGVTGDFSAILGGSNNTLTGTRSVVLGGNDITGVSNDTVYVPNLNINSTPATGTSVTVLARANDGTIIEVPNVSGTSIMYDDTNVRNGINIVSLQGLRNTTNINRTQKDVGNVTDGSFITYDRNLIRADINNGSGIFIPHLLIENTTLNQFELNGIFSNNGSKIRFSTFFEFNGAGNVETYQLTSSFDFTNDEVSVTNLNTGYTAFLVTQEIGGAFSDITDTTRVRQTLDFLSIPTGNTNNLIIDTALSGTSTNALENQVITQEINVLTNSIKTTNSQATLPNPIFIQESFRGTITTTDLTTINYDRKILTINSGGTYYVLFKTVGTGFDLININQAANGIFTRPGYKYKAVLFDAFTFTDNIELDVQRSAFDVSTTEAILPGLDSEYTAFPIDVTAIPTLDSTGGTRVTFSMIESPTGLEAIDEGNGIGYRLSGKDASFYGNIGEDATDLSRRTAASTTHGATGQASFASGVNTTASGPFSFATGTNSIASAIYSNAQGLQTQATGPDAHAEGSNTIASGSHSHAQGRLTQATGAASHAGGLNSIASGDNSFASGQFAQASGFSSTSLGVLTVAGGTGSLSMGAHTRALGEGSYAGGAGNDSTRLIKSEGEASFNHSFAFSNTLTGVTGNYSAILGGTDNNLTGTRSVILGGDNINGTSNDTVYVPNLNINTQPITGVSNTALSRTSGGTIIEIATPIIDVGIWTPVLTTTNGNVYTFTQSSATYYRIGDLVHLTCDLANISNPASTTGFLRISGLPFNISANVTGGPIYKAAGAGSSFASATVFSIGNTDTIGFYSKSSATGISNVSWSGSGNGASIGFSIHYIAND